MLRVEISVVVEPLEALANCLASPVNPCMIKRSTADILDFELWLRVGVAEMELELIGAGSMGEPGDQLGNAVGERECAEGTIGETLRGGAGFD